MKTCAQRSRSGEAQLPRTPSDWESTIDLRIAESRFNAGKRERIDERIKTYADKLNTNRSRTHERHTELANRRSNETARIQKSTKNPMGEGSRAITEALDRTIECKSVNHPWYCEHEWGINEPRNAGTERKYTVSKSVQGSLSANRAQVRKNNTKLGTNYELPLMGVRTVHK